MKEIGALVATIAYIYNFIYALVYWGFWWAILNLIIPFAVIYDWVIKLGRFN